MKRSKKTLSWKTCFVHGGERRKSRVAQAAAANSLSSDQTADLSQLFFHSLLTHGGQSRVYYGEYKNQSVAVKVIESVEDYGSSKSRLEKQFKREVSLLSRLHHPHVVKFIAAFSQKTVQCIVTEYLSEGSLRAYLNKQTEHLPLKRILSFALDIAKGMEYLHSQGIIHRDLKPDNILIDGYSFTMKIADFGISCEEDEDDGSDGENRELGSYRWMAPEMIQGKNYGRKVDVYSFGLLLYELVSGRIPLEGMCPAQAAYAVINKNLRPELPKNCPDSMKALIERCWARDEKKRPEFSQVVKILKEFESSLARFGSLQIAQEENSLRKNQKGFHCSQLYFLLHQAHL